MVPESDGAGVEEEEEEAGSGPVVSCKLQGGTLSVHEDHVSIERSSASMFDDKRIPMTEIRGVELSPGLLTGHIQILQSGVEADEGGLFSHPVDENTMYFPRLGRGRAERARDAILERAGDGRPDGDGRTDDG